MKKAFTNTGIFVGGFVACALALKTLGDPSVSLLPGVQSRSKQAVLTALNSSPRPAPHFAGDSVVADAAAKLEPSIVEIHTVGHPVQQAASPFGNDPVFGRMFGRQSGPPVVPEGAGSGVIISPDGYIMTNNHVVADSATVKVTVGQGENTQEYNARVVGTDPLTDIAVIKINPTTALRPAELGDSDAIRVGDWAIAVGDPLDIGTTVTLGIISAKDRKDFSAEGRDLSGSKIQTDAAINPGNSGGALADINGRVVGINEAILSPTGSFIGIGLAIPINDARKIAVQLIKNGRASHPYLGIAYQPLSTITDINERKQYGLPLDSDAGMVIASNPSTGTQAVAPGSPAAQAGLREGDVILQVDGRKITNKDMLNDFIQSKSVGDQLSLQVARRGQVRSVTVTLRERPASFGQSRRQPEQDPQGGDQQGNPFLP